MALALFGSAASCFVYWWRVFLPYTTNLVIGSPAVRIANKIKDNAEAVMIFVDFGANAEQAQAVVNTILVFAYIERLLDLKLRGAAEHRDTFEVLGTIRLHEYFWRSSSSHRRS